jgi:hypothetical protein
MSKAQWSAFEENELQPLFRDGFTVFQAHGTWKDPSTGAVERDPTNVVQAIVRPGSDVRSLIYSAAEKFKKANPAQTAIGAVIQDVCSNFDVRASALGLAATP